MKKFFVKMSAALVCGTASLLAPEKAPGGKKENFQVKKFSLGKQEEKKEVANVTGGKSELIELRLENTSIASVISHLAALKGINILPNKDTQDKKISFMCQRKLTVDQAWDAMLTLIQVHGFTVVKNGEVWKVVSTKEASGEPYRIFSSKNQIEIPDTDEIITLIYYPRNMKADQISELIGAIINEKVKPIADLEVCIVTARAAKIKNALAIIDPIDRDTLKQDMKIVQLKYTKPEEVARLLNDELINAKGNDGQRIVIRSMGKKDVACFSSNVKIFPDPHKQTLILLGQKQQIEKIADFVEKVLDMQLESKSSKPVKIYEVKYRDANELAKMLSKIIKIAQQGASQKSMPFQGTAIVPTGGQGGGGNGASVGNKLLIVCENADYPKLLSLIENLDTLKPQIVLEVMIVDVSDVLDRWLEGHIRDTGRNILGEKTGWLFANVGDFGIEADQAGMNTAMGGAAVDTQSDTTLFTFGNTGTDSSGKLANLWGYLYMAISKTKSNLISQPFTIVNNGEETVFMARQTKNLQSESTVKGQVAMKSWKPVNADHSIKITPRINAAGIVEMLIDITVDDFGTLVKDAPAPDIINRRITSKVFMNEGEVLFLGGLNKNTAGDKRISVPVLGELPIIGNFFKQKSKSQKQECLYMFVRPSLIKPRNDEQPDDYTKLKMDYAKLNIKRSDSFIKTRDPIEKFVFKPTGMPPEKVDFYAKNEYYPDVDDFWQRRGNPVTSDIARDVYYRSADTARQNYAKADDGKKGIAEKLSPEASSKSYKKRPVIS